MPTQVKGAVILARRAFVREEFGEDAWKRVLETLTEADRELLDGFILTASWYPFELNERLDAAVVEQLGAGDIAIFESIGSWSAKKNLAGPHKTFLTPGSPDRFMEMTDRIYDFYYDTGERKFEATGETSGVMTTYGAETFSETDCLTVIGWYREALKMCGATQVTIEETSCRARGDEFCRYEFSWS
ncbi:MAG: TIGR02265 family protein [Thermoanaerobaculia bacterium]